MIKKIWNDSVGSKVIASIIIGALSFVVIKIKSSVDEKTFEETFSLLINYQVKLIYLVLGFILFLVIRSLYRFFFRKKKDEQREGGQSLAEKKITSINNLIDSKQGIRNEFTVYIGDNGKPFITDLEFYCTKHENVPLRFYGNNCPISRCENSFLNLDEYKVKNHIESILIDKWNKIKK